MLQLKVFVVNILARIRENINLATGKWLQREKKGWIMLNFTHLVQMHHCVIVQQNITAVKC